MEKYKSSQYNILINQDDEYATIYNCFSGGIVKLENEIYLMISSESFHLESIKYGDELLKNGYIVNSRVDEFNKAKMQIESVMSNKTQENVSYVIAPTLNCNLRCVYCFQKDFRTDGSENIVTFDMLDQIRCFILESNKNNKLLKKININWFGGEPLLCYEQIVYFSKSLKAALSEKNIGFTCSMITNGTLLDEKKLRVLVSDCNLYRIQITIDGEENTYCSKKQTTGEIFNRVLNNICLATRYTKTTVRVNADKQNFNELLRVSKSISQMDIKKDNLFIHFAQLRDYNNNTQVLNAYDDLEYWQAKYAFYSTIDQHLPKKNTVPSFSVKPFCGLAKGNNLVIDYLGNLYKCEHYIGNPQKIVGTVADGVFYNSVYEKSFSLATDERCNNCDLFPICNYAQCTAMHTFAGDDQICLCYANQLETIKQKIKKYLEEHQDADS